MRNDKEYIFTCLLAMYKSSLKEFLFISYPIFDRIVLSGFKIYKCFTYLEYKPFVSVLWTNKKFTGNWLHTCINSQNFTITLILLKFLLKILCSNKKNKNMPIWNTLIHINHLFSLLTALCIWNSEKKHEHHFIQFVKYCVQDFVCNNLESVILYHSLCTHDSQYNYNCRNL